MGAMDYNTSQIFLGRGRNRQAAKLALVHSDFNQLERHVLLWVLDQAPDFVITVGSIQRACSISESTWVRLRKRLKDRKVLEQTSTVDGAGATHWNLRFDLRSLWADHA